MVPSTSSVSDHNDSHTSTGTKYTIIITIIHCNIDSIRAGSIF